MTKEEVNEKIKEVIIETVQSTLTNIAIAVKESKGQPVDEISEQLEGVIDKLYEKYRIK